MIEERPWGQWEMLADGPRYWVKRITVDVGGRLSLQRHGFRSERWVCVSGVGEALVIDWPRTLKNGNHLLLEPGRMVEVWVGAVHRLTNTGDEPLEIIEMAFAHDDMLLSEDDIVRIEDDYARVEFVRDTGTSNE